MHTTLSISKTPYVLAALCLALLTLTACKPKSDLQTKSDAYIRTNIATLSPRSAPSGSTYRVSSIEWEDDDTAIVTYGVGTVKLRGRTDVKMNGTAITATRLKLEASGSSDSSATSKSTSDASSTSTVSSMTSSNTSTSRSSAATTSSSVFQRAAAGEGEFCGGIAAFQCAAGLHCQYDGTYPDAGGTCVR